MAVVETKYFPTWRYGVNGAKRLIETPEDLAQLGEGWYDNPAKVPAAVKASKTAGPKSKKDSGHAVG